MYLSEPHLPLPLPQRGITKGSEEFEDWMNEVFYPAFTEAIADDNAVLTFTDGSLQNRGKRWTTGCGYLVMQGRHHIASGKFPCGKVTIYDAEMMGLARGIAEAIKQGKNTIHVYCDNESAIQSITDATMHSSQLVSIATCKKLRTWFDGDAGRKIYFHWIPGHVDIAPGDFVDELAKEAANIGFDADNAEMSEWRAEAIQDQLHPNTCSVSWARARTVTEMLGKWRRMLQEPKYRGHSMAVSPQLIRSVTQI